jgi:hypothetical protein
MTLEAQYKQYLEKGGKLSFNKWKKSLAKSIIEGINKIRQT